MIESDQDVEHTKKVLVEYWRGLSPEDRRSHYGVIFVLITMVLLGLAITIASLHILHTVDDDSEHVDENLHKFVMISLYASLLANFAMPNNVAPSGLITLVGLASTVGMIYMIRDQLRPNAEALDVSVPEVDLIEYGTYASVGSVFLVFGWGFYNRDMIMDNFIRADSKVSGAKLDGMWGNYIPSSFERKPRKARKAKKGKNTK